MSKGKRDANPPTPRTARDNGQPEQRKSRRELRGAVEAADWSTVDQQLLYRTVVAITRKGCAVQFGKTRDGGALAVRVVGDGPEPYTDYVRPSENLHLYLEGLCDDFDG